MPQTCCKLFWIVALPLGAAPVIEGVFVDGAGPFRFLVDTGAQSSVISPRVADRLQSKPMFAVEVSTVAGSLRAHAWHVFVRVGSRSARGEVLSYTTGAADGVLGQSFLSEFSYLIRQSGIEIGAIEPRGGQRMAGRLIDGRPAIPWNGLWLVVDSGASHIVLFRNGAGRRRRITTHAGARDVPGGEMHGEQVLFAGPQADRAEEGLLPTNLFQWVFVDRGGTRVVLGPRRRGSMPGWSPDEPFSPPLPPQSLLSPRN